MDTQALYTVKELALALRVSASTINIWTKRRIVTPLLIQGSRARLYSGAELQKARAFQARTARATRPEMPVDPESLSSALAAQYIGVPRMTLSRWVKCGMVPFTQGKNGPVFSRAALDIWMQKPEASTLVKRGRMSMAAMLSPERGRGEPASAQGLRMGMNAVERERASLIARMDVWDAAMGKETLPHLPTSKVMDVECDEW